MKTIISGICAAAMTLTALIAPVATSTAAPLSAPHIEVGQSDIVNVQSRRDRFERRGKDAYYNGKRGSRYKRPGYRQHNGFWFPATAFIAGAVIGGAIATPPRGANAHVRWCSDRYRSYRAYDNSYQPTNGPRRQCASPYR